MKANPAIQTHADKTQQFSSMTEALLSGNLLKAFCTLFCIVLRRSTTVWRDLVLPMYAAKAPTWHDGWPLADL
jgi:hypothetical protein